MELGLEHVFGLAFSGGENNLDVLAIEQQGESLERRMKDLTRANSTLAKSTVAAAVVAGTALAAYEAYTTISKRLTSVDDERQHYHEMIERGISTYLVAEELPRRKPWERYVAASIDCLQKMQTNPLGRLLWRLSGIYQKNLDTGKFKGAAYGVISAFATPLGIYFPETEDESDNLTQARKRLNAFLLGDLKQLLKEIEAQLSEGWLMEATLFLEAERYLTWLNASRFLVIMLGNMASNVLFAMNPNTNMPFSYEDSAKFCGLLRSVVAVMRSDSDGMFSRYRRELCCYQSIEKFLSSLDSRLSVLKEAYSKQSANKLNINEVSNSQHLILQHVSNNLRKLVYIGKPFIEPEHLNSKILDLDDLIHFHPELVSEMVQQLTLSKKFNYVGLGVNNPPHTVMDLLILWSDAERSVRRDSLKKMRKKATDWHQHFAATLKDINDLFLKPIEDLSTEKYLGGVIRRPKKNHQSPGRLFFIASVALFLEVYRLKLMESSNPAQGVTANQQVRDINTKVMQDNAVHGWHVLDVLNLQNATREAVKNTVKRLYKIVPIKSIVDLLALLQRKQEHTGNTDEFQQILKIRLQILKSKQKKLTKAIDELIAKAEHEKTSNKDLSTILSSLNDENPQTSLSISGMIQEFERAIQHSLDLLEESVYDDFMELQLQQLINKLQATDNLQFFQNNQDFERFYEALRKSIGSKSLFSTLSPEIAFNNNGTQHDEVETQSIDSDVTPRLFDKRKDTARHALSAESTVLAPSSTIKPLSDSVRESHGIVAMEGGDVASAAQAGVVNHDASNFFQLQIFFAWLSRASVALLLIGFFLILLMAFGAQTVPAINALGAPVITGFVIGGLVSAASGGLGLAVSYYTPRLFKSTKSKVDDDQSISLRPV